MNKSKIKKGIIVAALGLMLVGQTASASWHSSRITLPRNGWWYTTGRVSTSATQQMRVNRPTYDVVTAIARGNKTHLTANKTHRANADTTQNHTSNVRGSTTHGAFRSSVLNQKTNTVNLSWRP